MLKVKSTFQERCLEIKSYIKFVRTIEQDRMALAETPRRMRTKRDGVKKYLEITDTCKPEIINNDIKKILKANVYLLLYNLVESTARNTLEGIYNHLQTQSVTFHQVRDELKLEILNNLKSHVSKTDMSDFSQKLADITKDIIYVTFSSEAKFSGNVDARLIRDKALRMGFSIKNNPRTTGNGSDLLSIKNQRNSLAHGSISFADCGKDLTTQELEDMCKRTQRYLEAFIKCAERYLVRKEYQRSA